MRQSCALHDYLSRAEFRAGASSPCGRYRQFHPFVLGDPYQANQTQLEQVFVNLLLNAKDAMLKFHHQTSGHHDERRRPRGHYSRRTYRAGHSPGHPANALYPLYHDQATGRRFCCGPFHLLQHHEDASRRYPRQSEAQPRGPLCTDLSGIGNGPSCRSTVDQISHKQ